MSSSADEVKGMVDVSSKYETLRSATAQAILHVNPETTALIKDGKVPKGSIVDAARLSAVMAVKRTSDLIPFCHPVPIDSVNVNVSIQVGRIEILVEVKAVWKTGVEMEALTSASIAALTVYDMLKFTDKSMSIQLIKLLEKSGGIKEALSATDKVLQAAVLVASDTREKNQDLSGKKAVEILSKKGFHIAEYKVVRDDAKTIERELVRLCDELRVDIVITSGGTGLGHRDVTPDATRRVIGKEITGIEEAIRSYGQKRTPNSMLSRGVAGIRGNTIIVNLPGSVGSISESMHALFPGILHAFEVLEGKGH